MKGFSKNPFFYFGLLSFVLFGILFFSSDSLAEPNILKGGDVVFFNAFFKNADASTNNDLFFNQNKELAPETPDLKIIDNSIGAVATTSVLTTQTLGDIFGGQDAQRKDVVDYTVQPGDTLQSIADTFQISKNTVLWANNLSSASDLKAGQALTILPVSGLVHVVKKDDTVDGIAKTYKSKAEDIIAFNSLANESDIFIGDILILPDGQMPPKPAPLQRIPLASNWGIIPAEGIETQGLHSFNAVDIANASGTPIYAVADGVVQRAVFNGKYNFGMGNYITVLHANGVATYYGHLQYVFVRPGDHINVGDRIALMGRTGNATGYHLHFEVIGAENYIATEYRVGDRLKFK